MSSDEIVDDFGILKQAFHVDVHDHFDPNKVPQTGEEFLRKVVYERSKCKEWVRVDIDRTNLNGKQNLKLPEDENLKTMHTALLPSMEWQLKKVEDFKQLRLFIECQRIEEPRVTSVVKHDFLKKVHAAGPQLSKVIRYRQAVLIRMIQILAKHVQEFVEDANKFWGIWVYGILALLEEPLSPSSCHSLREFAKKCLTVRSSLPEHTKKDIYAPLNLFICIIARVFGQLDLADK